MGIQDSIPPCNKRDRAFHLEGHKAQFCYPMLEGGVEMDAIACRDQRMPVLLKGGEGSFVGLSGSAVSYKLLLVCNMFVNVLGGQSQTSDLRS